MYVGVVVVCMVLVCLYKCCVWSMLLVVVLNISTKLLCMYVCVDNMCTYVFVSYVSLLCVLNIMYLVVR